MVVLEVTRVTKHFTSLITPCLHSNVSLVLTSPPRFLKFSCWEPRWGLLLVYMGDPGELGRTVLTWYEEQEQQPTLVSGQCGHTKHYIIHTATRYQSCFYSHRHTHCHHWELIIKLNYSKEGYKWSMMTQWCIMLDIEHDMCLCNVIFSWLLAG